MAIYLPLAVTYSLYLGGENIEKIFVSNLPGCGRTAPQSQIHESVEADYGSTAWNGFGYHYGLHQPTGTMLELEAMPPDVGVKMPTIPKLRKQLVDVLGNPMPAPTELTFRFLVHEGESLRSSWTTEEELIANQ